MQPPYTVAQMAERAGTGDQTPIPQPAPACASCGCEIPVGRVYCSRTACIRKHNTLGKTTERRRNPIPTIGQYSA